MPSWILGNHSEAFKFDPFRIPSQLPFQNRKQGKVVSIEEKSSSLPDVRKSLPHSSLVEKPQVPTNHVRIDESAIRAPNLHFDREIKEWDAGEILGFVSLGILLLVLIALSLAYIVKW